MVSQLCLMCGSKLNCLMLCLGARPRYNLVVDEDVKKPTNQTNKSTCCVNYQANVTWKGRGGGGGSGTFQAVCYWCVELSTLY